MMKESRQRSWQADDDGGGSCWLTRRSVSLVEDSLLDHLRKWQSAEREQILFHGASRWRKQKFDERYAPARWLDPLSFQSSEPLLLGFAGSGVLSYLSRRRTAMAVRRSYPRKLRQR
jgi:hypothetical protein